MENDELGIAANKSREKFMVDRLVDISEQSQQVIDLIKEDNVALAATQTESPTQTELFTKGEDPVPHGCGNKWDLVAEGDGSGESSFDFRCNEQAKHQDEAKIDAEKKAKNKATENVKALIQEVTCESGCTLQADPKDVTTPEIVSSTEDGKRKPLTGVGCYWKWKAVAKAKIPCKCVKTV